MTSQKNIVLYYDEENHVIKEEGKINDIDPDNVFRVGEWKFYYPFNTDTVLPEFRGKLKRTGTYSDTGDEIGVWTEWNQVKIGGVPTSVYYKYHHDNHMINGPMIGHYFDTNNIFCTGTFVNGHLHGKFVIFDNDTGHTQICERNYVLGNIIPKIGFDYTKNEINIDCHRYRGTTRSLCEILDHDDDNEPNSSDVPDAPENSHHVVNESVIESDDESDDDDDLRINNSSWMQGYKLIKKHLDKYHEYPNQKEDLNLYLWVRKQKNDIFSGKLKKGQRKFELLKRLPVSFYLSVGRRSGTKTKELLKELMEY